MLVKFKLLSLRKQPKFILRITSDIMGSCHTAEQNEVLRSSLLRKKRRPLPLEFDASHILMSNYKQEGMLFEKTSYDWHSIPIMTTIGLKNTRYFEVANRGIKNDCFLVGIVKKNTILNAIRTPWKTNTVVCYESHENENESGILSEGEVRHCGRPIR